MLEAQATIDTMLDRRTPFDDIESYIENRHDLDGDARSALWLYAWVETDRPARQQVVGEMLVSLHSG